MSSSFVYGGAGLSTIDAKNRVTLPSDLRGTVEQSSGGNILHLAVHTSLPCLIGYGAAEEKQVRADLDTQWEIALQRGDKFDREAEGGRALASQTKIGFEPSGRFVMPAMHKHFGKLDGQAFFAGTGSHFMIWNPLALFEQSEAFAIQQDIARFFLDEAERKRK